MLKINNLRPKQLGLAVLITLGILLGLVLIQRGSEDIFYVDGIDRAEIDDNQVGILEIVSTRNITLTPEGTLQLVSGVAIAAATLVLARRIKQDIK
jgi:hypothetical protein